MEVAGKNAKGGAGGGGPPANMLYEAFPDELSAELWFERLRWGAGGPDRCPMCGGRDAVREVPGGRPMRHRCGSCRRYFGVRHGTAMQGSNIGLRAWAAAIRAWASSPAGVSSVELHRGLGVTQKSAHLMARRLREAWAKRQSGS